MPIHGTQRAYLDDGPAPRKFVLVISCIDCRLMDDLVRFLDHDNLTNRYYQVAFAGASLGLTDEIDKYPVPQCGRPDFGPWRAMLKEHIKVVIELTGGKLEDVYVVEHRDCGAFGKFLKDKDYYPPNGRPKLEEEARDHAAFAYALRDELAEWFATNLGDIETATGLTGLHAPRVHSFLMGLRGEVELLEPPKPKKTTKT